MSAVLSPQGLVPAYHPSGIIRPSEYRNGIPSAYATALYKGTPVTLNTSGQIVIAANAADMLGCFDGVEFTDATGRRVTQNFWPAGQTTLAGSETWVYVYDDPALVYQIQADATMAQTAIGDQVNFSSTAGYLVGSGSTFTGLSTTGVNATPVGATVQGMLRVIDKARDIDNDWGDTYTEIMVTVARHVYISNKVAI